MEPAAGTARCPPGTGHASSHQPQGPAQTAVPAPLDPLSDESFLQLQETSFQGSFPSVSALELSAKRQGSRSGNLHGAPQKALPQADWAQAATGESSQVQQPGRRETDTGKKKTVKMRVGPMGASWEAEGSGTAPHHSPPAMTGAGAFIHQLPPPSPLG